jgi:hypothetical protein
MDPRNPAQDLVAIQRAAGLQFLVPYDESRARDFAQRDGRIFPNYVDLVVPRAGARNWR